MLGYLWLGFLLACIVVFFAILVTGRYPRPLFDYNVGALRWNWRVQFYGYGALGTDRYPPFSLAPVPGYRVAFDVPYPERLSRGLVLVTWLLAVPHYLVLSVFIGGGLWFGSHQATDSGWTGNWSAGGGPVTLLVLISAVVLLFTGRYPPAAVRRRGRHAPLGAARRGLDRPDDRPLPAVPARPGR